jgi:sulfur carrier protein ThiS
VTLTTTATPATPGQTTTLTATLSDNTINTGKIVFKINGKTVKDANGKVIYAKITNGTVSVDYTLPETYKAGNYTVTATFIAPCYDRIEASETLTLIA